MLFIGYCLCFHAVKSQGSLILHTVVGTDVTECAVLTGYAEYSRESVIWTVIGGVYSDAHDIHYRLCCVLLLPEHFP